MSISAGSLDRRISFLHDVATDPNASGVVVPDWQPLARDVPAQRREIGGREIERNPQVMAELDTVFRTRWLNISIDTSMRIEDEDGRQFEIRSIAALPGPARGFRHSGAQPRRQGGDRVMPVKARIRGGQQTARALRELGRRSSTEKVLRQALRPGAREVVQAARAGAPRETGALRRSIAIGIRRTRRFAARLLVGHRRDDPAQRWRISHIVEFGSRFVSAQPYMRPAAQGLQRVVQTFGAAIWPLIAKEATRVASRGALRGSRRR